MVEDNLYELLGLTENATGDEIKRAYYRKIRIHTNERHPDKFQKLTKAYQTLYDEQKRKEYDRYNQDGGLYTQLSNEVTQAINQGQYGQAVKLLKRMLVRYPEDQDVRYSLANCSVHIGRNEEAKRYASELVLENPLSEKYRLILARIYIELEEIRRAEIQIKKLIDINPLEANYYLELASITSRYERYNESVNVLEQGLKVIPSDLESYVLLSELYFLSYYVEDAVLRRNVLERIKQLATPGQREMLLQLIINECESINSDNPGLPDLVRLIDEINNDESVEVTSWLHRYNHLLNQRSQSYNQSTSKPEVIPFDKSGRGTGSSLLIAIVIGFILTALWNGLIGVIGGFLVYRYGAARLFKGIGWLILIVILLSFLQVIF